MYVVTFSGVTSGGMVTSGTTCWTCVTEMDRLPSTTEARLPRSTPASNAPRKEPDTYTRHKGLLDERSDYGALSDAVYISLLSAKVRGRQGDAPTIADKEDADISAHGERHEGWGVLR